MAIHFGANEPQTAPLLRPAPRQPVCIWAGGAIFGCRARSRCTPKPPAPSSAGQQCSRPGSTRCVRIPAESADSSGSVKTGAREARNLDARKGSILFAYSRRARSRRPRRLVHAPSASTGWTRTRPTGSSLCPLCDFVSRASGHARCRGLFRGKAHAQQPPRFKKTMVGAAGRGDERFGILRNREFGKPTLGFRDFPIS